MSRITARPTTGSLDPFGTGPGSSNYTGTYTPTNRAQSYSAIPAGGIQPSSGTGAYDPNATTYVGQKFDTSDGRVLTFVQNGAVALASGVLTQAPVQVTAFQKLAMTVPTATPATAGTFQILVTNGATKLNLNQFQQGYLITASGTGLGQTLKIASHQAAAASGTFLVTLEDPIQTTLDATTTVNLIANPYIGVVISSHTTLGTPVGVTLTAIAASTAATFNATTGALTTNGTAQYGLIVTKGPTGCLIDTVTNVGYPLGPSTNTDGALNVATLTSSPQVGISGQTQTSAQYGLVYLQL